MSETPTSWQTALRGWTSDPPRIEPGTRTHVYDPDEMRWRERH